MPDQLIVALVKRYRRYSEIFRTVPVQVPGSDCARVADTIEKLLAEKEAAEAALRELADKCAAYRRAHDLHGDGARPAGYAWDQMRRAEERARQHLPENSDG